MRATSLSVQDTPGASAKTADAAELDARRHWAAAAANAVVDVALVALTAVASRWSEEGPPSDGMVDMSAPVGWLGMLGAIVIFGGCGIMIKTPAVKEVNCDGMVFQCYYSAAVAGVSLLMWFAASIEEIHLDRSSLAMGFAFAAIWISSQALGVSSIRAVGYAVASAVWIGITICTAFLWGALAFDHPVRYPLGAAVALALMVIGVCLAAASCAISERASARAVRDASQGSLPLVSEAGAPQSGRMAYGVTCAAMMGLGNGCLMVPLTLFQHGSPQLGVRAYRGRDIAPLAFLPSLALGIFVVQPVLFLLAWGPAMRRGSTPKFHFAKVAAPGLLTGAFWGMGNFCAMFATAYLGQTVGYPLTQLCLLLSGLWGILYFKEIQGVAAINTFACAAVVILAGAVLDGLSC
mmetsp:Transcript_20976/g.60603  ORF Transcript_20976/g.60603 Transcript_20976/m.60603 type:complete len:408 (-) Transcript_20976:79-1302(-)